MWFVYMLRCSNGSLYTGMTNDLEKRVAAHNAGTGGKYTRAFRPVRLVWSQTMKTESRARKREAELKTWTKEKKENLLH